MAITTILERGPVSVVDYRCDAQPGDKPFPELHESYPLSYVRTGSFGYRSGGRVFELVAARSWSDARATSRNRDTTATPPVSH